MHNLLNEFADLSQRLDHLVAYSSQMVFISGEQMGNQKKFVEAFLGSREQDQDIVYLTGNSFHNEDDVRQEFSQQLAGNASQVDVSLLQLLSNRNKDRALLIAITRAERLPDQILQELWDLVLQNRFARNHQHINILLFGEQEWAEKTKSWLPTNNNDKPVLLTSETVEVQGEQELEGDLDAYIKSKRKEFNERLKQRALSHETPTPIWAKWWLKLLAVCVFILAFSGIMLWQYFDLSQTAVKDFASFLFQAESSSSVDEWVQTKDLLAETQDLSVNETEDILASETIETTPEEPTETNSTESTEENSNSTFVTSWQAESEKLARQSIPLNLSTENQLTEKPQSSKSAVAQPEDINTTSGSLDMANSESVTTVSREQLLQLQGLTENDLVPLSANESTELTQEITPEIAQELNQERNQGTPIQNQPEAVSSQDEPTVITEPLIPNELAGALAKNPLTEAALVGPPIPERIKQARKQQTISNANITASVPTAANSESENLTPSESEATKTATSAPILAEAPIEEAGAVEDYPVADIVSVEELVAQQAPTQSKPPQPTYQFDETALLTLPKNNYLLQVSGMSSKTVLNEYLRDNRLNSTVWVYKTKRYGGDWYVVLYNKAFASLNEARSAVNQLPQTTRQSAPFAKSITMIKEEIAQGYPLQ